MLEQLMFLAMGFLAGALVVLAFMPAVHERAVRLTARQIRAATPPTVEEMHIQRDLMRAEYALKVSRFETIAEEAKASVVGYRAEIGRRAAEVRELKVELGRVTALLFKLHGRQKAHRTAGQRIAKLVLYLYRRLQRLQREPAPSAVAALSRLRELRVWSSAPARVVVYDRRAA
jgi:hypothetical protein